MMKTIRLLRRAFLCVILSEAKDLTPKENKGKQILRAFALRMTLRVRFFVAFGSSDAVLNGVKE